MSHFVVLVIGEDVDGQLAPYNEQPERDDPRAPLEFFDETDELRKKYEEKFSDRYATFESFCKEYYGYEPDEQGRCGYYTNPKGKWDWYEIGGRWTGYFLAKPGVTGRLGRPGVFGGRAAPGRYDQLRYGDIDFEGMRAEAAAEANKRYDAYEAATKGLEVPPAWPDFYAQFNSFKEADKAYRELPYTEALHNAGLLLWFEDPVDTFSVGREAFVERVCRDASTPYAVLKNGQWHAKGEVGWFNTSNDKTAPDAWNERVQELLRDLPEDTLLTAVDCHI